MGVWQFVQDQVLGMKWLNELIGSALSLLGLDIGGRIGGSVQFFIYDGLKITILLCFLIFVISRAISHRSGANAFWAVSTEWELISFRLCWEP